MCASYGLDPRFEDDDFVDVLDTELLRSLRTWAEGNANETLRPTGKNLRNLNPILVSRDDAPALELGWWGYLVDGEPAKFPSINTRSERLQQRPAALSGRAIVPVTCWFEMQKPSRTWYGFGERNHALLGLAAVTQRGRTSDGASFTCYSIIMQPAAAQVAAVHDRMPILIPAEFALEWLGSAARPGDLLEVAVNESVAMSERLLAEAMANGPKSLR